MHNNILMLMMAGSGTRLGAERPKQFLELDGIPIFAYILEGYCRMSEISQMVLVVHSDWMEYTRKWTQRIGATENIWIVEGGTERVHSLRNGIQAISEHAKPDDVLLIHDATHPYVPVEDIRKIIQAVQQFGAATLAQGEYDTVYRRNMNGMLQEVVPRAEIVSGASPEAFRFGILEKLYQELPENVLAKMTSAGAIALHEGIPMKVIETDTLNLKITYPRDMELLTKLIDNYFFPGAKERILSGENE